MIVWGLNNMNITVIGGGSFGTALSQILSFNHNVTIIVRSEELAINHSDNITLKAGGGYSDEFESFWTHYPRKTKKTAAYREWKKLDAESRLMAIDYVPAFAEAWSRHNPHKDRYHLIIHPERWLKNHCWEDDPHEWILMARGK